MPPLPNSASPLEPRRFFTNPDISLSGATLPPLGGGGTALTVVQQIARMRDTITFADLKRRAEFLAGEPFDRTQPGMWTYEHLIRVDPTPIGTAVGPILEVYRFTVNRGYGAPHMITGTAFERDAIQFPAKVELDRDFAEIQHRSGRLIEWPIRIPPGGELTVTRALLGKVSAQIRDAGENQPAHFHQISQIAFGTVPTLGLPARYRISHPFSVITVDRRGLELPMSPRIGWIDRITERALGEHLSATLDRERGVIVDRGVKIRNEGDVAFHLTFARPPQG